MIRQTISSYPRGQKIVTQQVLSLDGYDTFHLPEGYNLKVCFACQHRGRLQKRSLRRVKGGDRPKSFGFKKTYTIP